MTTIATLVNTVNIQGITPIATLVAEMLGVPLPLAYLYAIGVYPASTTVPSANPVVRTDVLNLVPSSLPTATVTIVNDSVQSVTLTSPGDNVVAAPIVQVVNGGAVENAIIRARLFLHSVTVLDPGSGYSVQSTVIPVGGAIGNNPAKFNVTISGGGGYAGVTVASGGIYQNAPLLVAFDPTGAGSGAVFGTSNMRVLDLTLLSGGLGYGSGSTLVEVVSLFKYIWPDAIGATQQGTPFVNLIKGTLQANCASPIVTALPAVT